MGFSVSAASVIVFIGVLISFSMLYTTAANSTERMTDARSDARELALAQSNTAVNVTEVTYDAGNDTLTINATNEGARALSVDGTDVVVDNRLRTPASTAVDGDAATDVWAPGEELSVELSLSTAPERVSVVTGVGVAGTGVVG